MAAPRAVVAVQGLLRRQQPRLTRSTATGGSEKASKGTSSGGGSAALAVGGVGLLGAAAGLYAWQSSQSSSDNKAALATFPRKDAPEIAKRKEVLPEVSAPRAPEVEGFQPLVIPAKKPVALEVAARDVVAEEAAAAAAAEAASVTAEAAAAAQVAAQEAAAAASHVLQSVEAERVAGLEQREGALLALRSALGGEDAAAISEALSKARKACISATSEFQLAESLSVSARLSEGFAEASLEKLMQLPSEFHGLNEDQAEASERARNANLGRGELEARVLELTRHLAHGRLHAQARLDQALLTQLEGADAASLRALGQALEKAGAERDQVANEEYAALEVTLRERQEAEVVKAIADAQAAAAAKLEDDRQKLLAAASQAALEAQADRLAEVVSLSSGLAALEEVLMQDEAVVQRAHAYNSLSASLLSLEDAILAGRGACTELEALRQASADVNDAFVANLLSTLPADSADLCRRAGSVPTEPLLRQRLSSQLSDLATAAFVPAGSGLLGEVIGKVFRQLYILGRDSVVLDIPQETEASRNLAALGSAAGAVAGGGELREALDRLEGSLRGTCQERASTWLEEARAALQLRQTLEAVKARVQCLNATLL
ncbi:unnamed protein product [Polarella glacialis]|uniref:Mitofilin n=1 Tax=Polarella glacialis TaxID=89957 RepID=A0A813EME8_POLGL|nr:unnamed protein product [Polarella glacialis]CAE8731136.1 unnamed protein product [Polarella glacialis]